MLISIFKLPRLYLSLECLTKGGLKWTPPFGSFNPIRPGGLRGPDDQTHSCQSETSCPMMPKLGDF